MSVRARSLPRIDASKLRMPKDKRASAQLPCQLETSAVLGCLAVTRQGVDAPECGAKLAALEACMAQAQSAKVAEASRHKPADNFHIIRIAKSLAR